MCTAITLTVEDTYFGRNLDFEHSFGEKVIITPRNYNFLFRNGNSITQHYAIIGMGIKNRDYPLYFDATNEKGLSIAGLNFPDNAHYNKPIAGRDNIASFEIIPWILAQCKSVESAKRLIKNLNITQEKFSDEIGTSPLHWMISDRKQSITLEQTRDKIKVYDNPVGVLTNNPTFDIQMFNLNNYMSISSQEPENKFSDSINIIPYSRGMGGLGLPGDLSSVSRFVRASFVKLNSVCKRIEEEAVSQFFHILYSVYQQRGTVKTGGAYEVTNYTSCCNTDKGIYYYTTYNNPNVNAVCMFNEDINADKLIEYELKTHFKVNFCN